MRKAVGPEMRLGVDINQFFDTETALETAKRAEPYDLMWIEEPLPREPKGRDTAIAGYDWDAQLGTLAG